MEKHYHQLSYQNLGIIANEVDEDIADEMKISAQTGSSDRNLSSKIFMATSHDGGRNFGKAFIISDSNGFSVDPFIMILPNSTSDVVTMWTDNSTNNQGIFNIFLKALMPYYSGGENVYEDGQTNVLLTPGSVIRPQMVVSNADSTLGPENEKEDNKLNLIIAGVEYESGYSRIFLTRVDL